MWLLVKPTTREGSKKMIPEIKYCEGIWVLVDDEHLFQPEFLGDRHHPVYFFRYGKKVRVIRNEKKNIVISATTKVARFKNSSFVGKPLSQILQRGAYYDFNLNPMKKPPVLTK
jgi:hypothetical protein